MAKPKISQKKSARPEEVPIKRILVDDLRLDPKNPRLPEEMVEDGLSQNRLLELMVRYFSLKDLGRSFADHGYFEQEPVVIIGPSPDGKYTVVEGNRRLAALRLLTESDIRIKLGDQEWEELASAANKHDLSRIPAIRAENRKALTSFLGFRHVSGILGWEPVEKARFIHHLIEQDKLDFKQAARMIGSKSDAARKLYIAYRIIVQARDEFDIDYKGPVEHFGVFLRSLNSAGVRSFIGLTSELKTPKQCHRPIPPSKAESLRESFSLIFGERGRPAVISDSRQLTKLGAVLVSKPALEHLRANRQLEQAFELSEGEEYSLVAHLERASFALDQTLRYVHRHRESEDIALRIRRCCDSLREITKHFPEIYRECFRGAHGA